MILNTLLTLLPAGDAHDLDVGPNKIVEDNNGDIVPFSAQEDKLIVGEIPFDLNDLTICPHRGVLLLQQVLGDAADIAISRDVLHREHDEVRAVQRQVGSSRKGVLSRLEGNL